MLFTPTQITRVIETIKRVNKLESQVRTLKGITQEGGLFPQQPTRGHKNSIDEASKLLGIDPATLWRKRKKI